jgi:cysteine desulfurase
MIFFDHNATTPLDDRVLEAMLPFLHTLYGNPSSLYRLGRFARSAVDTARAQLAMLLDAKPEQIVFTSGGTEANALALACTDKGSLFISATEHPSVVEQAQALPLPLQFLPVNHCGLLNANCLSDAGVSTGDFVSVMLANNETGVIQDIAALAASAKNLGAILHCDAVQALGKLNFSFRQLDVHLMSVSSHKIYGPKGCGALAFADGIKLTPLQRGGNQELSIRAGTENVAAIVGFGKAAELARLELEQRITHLYQLRTQLEQALSSIPGLTVFAQAVNRLANTVQFAVAGFRGDMLLMQLDLHNIAVSSGSACKAGSGYISPVLQAMGVEPDLARGAVRISLGKDNSAQEVNEFVTILKQLLS